MNRAGITTRVISVAKINPQDRASAMDETNGSRPPQPYAVGNRPTIVVIAVNIIAVLYGVVLESVVVSQTPQSIAGKIFDYVVFHKGRISTRRYSEIYIFTVVFSYNDMLTSGGNRRA